MPELEAAVAAQITDFAFVVAGIIVVLNLLSILIFKVARLTCCAPSQLSRPGRADILTGNSLNHNNCGLWNCRFGSFK